MIKQWGQSCCNKVQADGRANSPPRYAPMSALWRIRLWLLFQNKKTTETVVILFWQPQPDSNRCSRLERAVSQASRRWGQNCLVRVERWQIITGLMTFVKYLSTILFRRLFRCVCVWQFFDLYKDNFFAAFANQRQFTVRIFVCFNSWHKLEIFCFCFHGFWCAHHHC